MAIFSNPFKNPNTIGAKLLKAINSASRSPRTPPMPSPGFSYAPFSDLKNQPLFKTGSTPPPAPVAGPPTPAGFGHVAGPPKPMPVAFSTPVVPQVTPSPRVAASAPVSAPVTAQTTPAPISTPPVPQIPQISTQEAAPRQSAPTPTPTAPLPSESQKAVDLAQKAYDQSLKISPEELSTQEDIDRLVESTQKAYLNTSQQVIPMEFITGQLAAIERRALGLAEPLERKLARMQAARQSSLESSKFALERADKALSAERSLTAPVEVSQGASITKYNPATGKYENVYTAPKTDEGYTLGEGQVRFDASGREIARGPAKETSIKQNLVKVDGVDYLVDEQGNLTKPVVPEAVPSTEKVAKANDVVSRIDALLNNPNLSKAVGPVSSKVPGFLRSGARNDVEAAISSLIAGVAIENLSLLKGPMSDKDVAFIKEASAGLNTNMSEEGFKSRLQSLKTKFQEIAAKAAQGVGSNQGGGDALDRALDQAGFKRASQSASKTGVVAGYDIRSYATDPNHERRIASIYSRISNLTNSSSIDSYIRRIAPRSPVTGNDIMNSARKFNVDPRMILAIMEQDSSIGTKGKAVRTRNPGNVGNTDSGATRTFPSWSSGVDAVAQNLARRKIS